VRQVDPGRTHRFASLAVEAVFDDGSSVSPSVIKIGQNEPYRADINVAVVMASNQLVYRAYISAGPAADAPERLRKKRVAGKGKTPVVQKNYVHLFF
jgi:saccharopine dehydrogenase-like NADP-dependent oxidoreductase